MQQNISSKEASIGIRLSYCQPMYILANLPIQFQHLRLISKHPQMLVNDILIIAHSRSCLCGKRFQLMHLAGRLVYQGEHCLERQPVLFQQFSSQHIHVIGKIARKHSRQMQTFALLRTCFIHFSDRAEAMSFRSCTSSSELLSTKHGICPKSTSRCLLKVCIG